jgi:hypothetical protein
MSTIVKNNSPVWNFMVTSRGVKTAERARAFFAIFAFFPFF